MKPKPGITKNQPELELELIQTQMAQKPMQRVEVYAHADNDPSYIQLYNRKYATEISLSALQTAEESPVCHTAKLLLLATELAAAKAAGLHTSLI
jgi:hypothetical protein